jgi:hypothetical protein
MTTYQRSLACINSDCAWKCGLRDNNRLLCRSPYFSNRLVQYDQFGTIIEEWFDGDSRCQLCNAFHHIFLGEHLHAVGDHLVVAAPGTCFFHHLVADQRHCFRIVELNAPCTSFAGEFSECENGEAILFFGCQFHKSILHLPRAPNDGLLYSPCRSTAASELV